MSSLRICIGILFPQKLGSDALSEEDCSKMMEEYDDDFEEFRIMMSQQYFYDSFKSAEMLRTDWL